MSPKRSQARAPQASQPDARQELHQLNEAVLAKLPPETVAAIPRLRDLPVDWSTNAKFLGDGTFKGVGEAEMNMIRGMLKSVPPKLLSIIQHEQILHDLRDALPLLLEGRNPCAGSRGPLSQLSPSECTRFAPIVQREIEARQTRLESEKIALRQIYGDKIRSVIASETTCTDWDSKINAHMQFHSHKAPTSERFSSAGEGMKYVRLAGGESTEFYIHCFFAIAAIRASAQRIEAMKAKVEAENSRVTKEKMTWACGAKEPAPRRKPEAQNQGGAGTSTYDPNRYAGSPSTPSDMSMANYGADAFGAGAHGSGAQGDGKRP